MALAACKEHKNHRLTRPCPNECRQSTSYLLEHAQHRRVDRKERVLYAYVMRTITDIQDNLAGLAIDVSTMTAESFAGERKGWLTRVIDGVFGTNGSVTVV